VTGGGTAVVVVVVVVDVELVAGDAVVVTIAVVAGATEVDVRLRATVIGATLEVVGAVVARDVVGEPAAESLQADTSSRPGNTTCHNRAPRPAMGGDHRERSLPHG
jgi:formate/nitrite transporter FocA (FNT family)